MGLLKYISDCFTTNDWDKAYRERMAKEKKEKEEIFDFSKNIDSINERTQKRNAEALRSVSKEYKEKKNDEAEKKEKASDALKIVIDGAKLKCDLCTNPVGDLKVNFDTPTTQDKKTATVKEKDMKSLIFKGNCKKSPQSSSPCASVMQLGDWKDVGNMKVQEQFPLLLKSTIKCNYGGTDIKITDCGQRNVPSDIDIIPIEEKQILSAVWMCADMEEDIQKARVSEKVSLLVKTRNYEEGETISVKIKENTGRAISEGIKEVILSGNVQANGYAELKEKVTLEAATDKPRDETANELQKEEAKKNEIHLTHEGKAYTRDEWKTYQNNWHDKMEKINSGEKKGLWG